MRAGICSYILFTVFARLSPGISNINPAVLAVALDPCLFSKFTFHKKAEVD